MLPVAFVGFAIILVIFNRPFLRKAQWMLPTKPSGSYEPAAEKVTSSGGGPEVMLDAAAATE